MTTHRADDGRRYLLCEDCGAKSPPAVNGRAARNLSKTVGWGRTYRGRGETFLCPECRKPKSSAAVPFRVVTHLVSPTNPRFSMCGRHHVQTTDDVAEMDCGLCQRSLDRVNRASSSEE